jgi:hypothetical protein
MADTVGLLYPAPKAQGNAQCSLLIVQGMMEVPNVQGFSAEVRLPSRSRLYTSESH